jgi:Gas vesicle synthesis protein GvpL/GvpF
VIWLYAVTDRCTDALPNVTGHDFRRLQQTCTAELAGIWSECSREQPARLTEDALWRQETVLEALMDDRTVLPLRFGTVLGDVDELLAVLTRRQDSLRRALDRVRGCVEMGVRARLEPADIPSRPSGGSGTDYLRARAGEHAIAGTLHRRLAAVSSAADKTVRRGAVPVFVGAYLVPEPGVGRFRDAVHELVADHPDLSIACTGPWPPHSFTDEGELAS